MKLDDYNVLRGMLDEFRQEAAGLEEQIENNLNSIRGAEVYLETIIKSESEDYKVFSPRRAEIIYKEEIDRTNEKKEDYKRLNQELYRKKEILNNYIGKLENIFNSLKHDCIILNIQEEDRQRIARDLHDTSLQNLTHLIHKLELSSMYIDKDPVQAKLELSLISKCLRETMDEIRGIIYNLRPITFDDLGLKDAMECLLAGFNENRKYEIISEIEDFIIKNDLILLSVYRIVRELLCNIEKHAEASKIMFRCYKKEDNCVLSIEDNGKGFSEEPDDGRRHFGILLIRERVDILYGRMDIFSKPGEGTRIYIEIPLEEVSE